MKGEGGEGGQEALLLIFVIWRCFDCRWVRVGGVVQKVSFVFSLLMLLKEMRTRGQSNPFHCFHSFRNLPKSQKLWKKSSKSMPTRILMTWTSVTSPKTRHQPRHPLPKKNPPITSAILTTPQEVHSSIPPSSKEKQPPKEESNSKTITPRSSIQHPWPHNPPQPHHPPSHWNVKAPSKSQNPHTIQKMITITSRVTFTYSSNTPTTTSTNTHAFILFPHHISKNDCGATGHHPAKA